MLKALPGAVLEREWGMPAWRVDDLLLFEPGIGPKLTAVLPPYIEPLEPRDALCQVSPGIGRP